MHQPHQILRSESAHNPMQVNLRDPSIVDISQNILRQLLYDRFQSILRQEQRTGESAVRIAKRIRRQKESFQNRRALHPQIPRPTAFQQTVHLPNLIGY